MKNNLISEEQLRCAFLDEYLKKTEFALYTEVPVFCRSVDLVMRNKINELLNAIEFKIHDWKRAILQVQSVAMCFDFLYICIPKPRTAKGYHSVVSSCENNGIGLYLYDSETKLFETAVEGQRTEMVWSAQRNRVIGYLEAKENERST